MDRNSPVIYIGKDIKPGIAIHRILFYLVLFNTTAVRAGI